MPLPPATLARVRERIAEHAGLQLPEWVLEARLSRRIAALRLQRAEEYADLVASPGGRAELDHLLERVVVGETRFFRHPSHVKALTDVVVPALQASRRGGKVRAWSAGCATGEEAYTLAMALLERLRPPTWEVKVTASDLSTEQLEVARRGIYPTAALDHVPDDWRWGFEPAGDDWKVTDAVTRAVSFERRNLADASFPRGFDVIWCRNVLIYFGAEAREQVVTRLVDSLAPGGFLFVGYAETLRDCTAVEAVSTPDTVLYQKRDRKRRASDRQLQARTPSPKGGAQGGRRVPDRELQARTPLPPQGGGQGGGSRDSQQPATTTIHLRGRYDDDTRLARELADAIAGPHASVVIDLDHADYLFDGAAAVVRRARSAARPAGVDFTLVATRPGPLRWLKRTGLEEDDR